MRLTWILAEEQEKPHLISMKSLRRCFWFVLFFHLTSSIVRSQVKVASFDEFTDFKGIGLSGYLSLHVSDNHKGLDTLCLRTCLFIKFRISKEGEITNISSNVGAPPVIAEGFKRALLSTNGRWSPHIVNGTPIDSPYFLLPIYIHLRACKDEQSKQDSFFKNFTNSYEFDDKTTLENELCIFLKPAMVVALH